MQRFLLCIMTARVYFRPWFFLEWIKLQLAQCQHWAFSHCLFRNWQQCKLAGVLSRKSAIKWILTITLFNQFGAISSEAWPRGTRYSPFSDSLEDFWGETNSLVENLKWMFIHTGPQRESDSVFVLPSPNSQPFHQRLFTTTKYHFASDKQPWLLPQMANPSRGTVWLLLTQIKLKTNLFY